MVKTSELVAYLAAMLDSDGMEDYGPNGLQVEGRADVSHVVTGVTASRRLIEHALNVGADAVLVHHGLLWRSGAGPPPLVGWLGDRVRLLMKSDVNLLAFHLPLDVHPDLGNNRLLLDGIGVGVEGSFGENGIGLMGSLASPAAPGDLVASLAGHLGSPVTLIDGGNGDVTRVGVVTGAGQRYLEAAAAAGCDAFVTGEASEFVTHVAREAGIHYLWAGHHATERAGVRALGAHVAQHFGVDVDFVDDPNPV